MHYLCQFYWLAFQHNGICIIPNGIWVGRKKKKKKGNITDDIWKFRVFEQWGGQCGWVPGGGSLCAGEIKTMGCLCPLPHSLSLSLSFLCSLDGLSCSVFMSPVAGQPYSTQRRRARPKKNSLNAFLFPFFISFANCHHVMPNLNVDLLCSVVH